MNYFNNFPLKNILFMLYIPLVITFLSISVCTNMYSYKNTQQIENNNFATNLNQLSNNALAILFMPMYFSYRIITYIYNNFDMLMEQLMLKIQLICRTIFVDIIYKLIILNIYNFIDYVYVNIFVPFIRFIFIDVIYKLIILNVYNFIRFIFVDIIYEQILLNVYNFIRFIFIDVICKIIIPKLQNFIEYVYTNLVIPLLRFIFVDIIYKQILLNIYNFIEYVSIEIINAVIKTFYQVLELLRWAWMLLLNYVVYPVVDIISYLYSLSTNTIYNTYIKISNTLANVYNSLILVFNYTYFQISNTLINIWNSLTITLNNVYDNLTISITQTWNRFVNIF